MRMPFVLSFVFSLSLFLSASLLFNIQPMIGKMLLPLVGGAPAVWNVAMAFFQISLLAGYLIAHWLTRLPPLAHGFFYLAALGVSCAFLPIGLPQGWAPDLTGHVPLSILGILTTTIVVPFISLSLGAPTLQRLFAATRHPRAHDPYFLYAASNVGSFAGLLLYPFFLEINYTLGEQAIIWKLAFYALGVSVSFVLILLAVYQRKEPEKPAHADSSMATPNSSSSSMTTRDRLFYVLLAFIPSSLTLGVTQYIAIDIVATPLLWVLTLGLYLLTFIVAFAHPRESLVQGTFRLMPFIVASTLAASLLLKAVSVAFLPVHLLSFVLAAATCHFMLAARRPDPKHLTEYFFWIALGGALGGVFNALIAPVIFPDLFEYPLVLMLALLVAPVLPSQRYKLVLLVAATLCGAGISLLAFQTPTPDWAPLGLAVFLTLLFFYILSLRSRLFMAGSVLAVILVMPYMKPELMKERGFFGVLKVVEEQNEQVKTTKRSLLHGTTAHGTELISEADKASGTDSRARPTLTGYYSPRSPVSTVFRLYQPREVLVTGLGAGSMSCYASDKTALSFIEIDPLVVDAARNWFSFLKKCPPAEIIIGDGRLALETAFSPDKTFDMIVLDAFSSDSVPAHLLTKEAFERYLVHLKPEGILVVHISNRYLRLDRMLSALSREMGLAGVLGASGHHGWDEEGIHFPSIWVVLGRKTEDLARLEKDTAISWKPLSQYDKGLRAWTDGYSNLFQVIDFPLK